MTQRILMLIDETPVLERMRTALVSAGFEVESAATLGRAMEVLQEPLPDLILLDSKLDTDNGTHAFQVLRGGELTRDIPIIVLTGRGGDMHRILSLQNGAEDCVDAPYSARELILRIWVALRRRFEGSGPKMKVAGSTPLGDLFVTSQ